jgi:hypothetical protein
VSDSPTGEGAFRPGESVVERRIRLAMERGDFSDLPGRGEPIEGLDDTYDPLWWVKKWAEREALTASELAVLIADRKQRG